MKSPQECKSIQEVRECIDSIDNQIIELLATRFEYVKAVVPFKEKTADGIIAKERKEQVLRERRALAEKHGLSPDIIEEMYKMLIQYFIDEEMQLLDKH
jgi:isochorismate pyruvate lyase